MNCPIIEQTADGDRVGRCWHHLPDGKTCPRHGEVEEEVRYFKDTTFLTLEAKMWQRKKEEGQEKGGGARKMSFFIAERRRIVHERFIISASDYEEAKKRLSEEDVVSHRMEEFDTYEKAINDRPCETFEEALQVYDDEPLDFENTIPQTCHLR